MRFASQAAAQQQQQQLRAWAALELLFHLALAVEACCKLSVVAGAGGTSSTQTDIAALLATKAALIDPQGVLANWSNATLDAPCSWRGVTCSSSGSRVTELGLEEAGLQGPLAGRPASCNPACALSLSFSVSQRGLHSLSSFICKSYSKTHEVWFLCVMQWRWATWMSSGG